MHQALAVGHFGVDDLAAAFGGDRQGLFAEHRFAGSDGGQHELFVARAPGSHEYRFNLRRVDQRMAVGVDLGTDVQVSNHLGGLLKVDVGHRHYLAIEQRLATTTDMVAADSPCTDYA